MHHIMNFYIICNKNFLLVDLLVVILSFSEIPVYQYLQLTSLFWAYYEEHIEICTFAIGKGLKASSTWLRKISGTVAHFVERMLHLELCSLLKNQRKWNVM